MGSIVYDMRNRMEDNSIPDLQNITIAVFFDGTLNNRDNSELRESYEAEAKIEAERKKKKESYTWNLADKDKKAYKKYGSLVSYQNDISNVAKLEKVYKKNAENPPYIESIYIEGIGTEEKEENEDEKTLDYKGETTSGMAFGTKETGIRGKIFKACEKIAKKETLKKIDELKQITFDIFGFSRGAAAARSFAYEVLREESVYKLEKVKHDIVKEDGVRKLKPRKNERGGTYVDVQIQGKNVKYEKILPSPDSLRSDIDTCSYDIEGYLPKRGMLGTCLKEIAGMDLEKINAIKIKIRFIGVFDTVASYSTSIIPEFEQGAAKLNLNRGLDKAEFSLHLIAENEHRKNFALTPICADYSSNKNIHTSDNKLEILLPGVHSDIGGSYRDNDIETKEVEVQTSGLNDLEKFQRKLLDERWFNRGQLRIEKNKLSSNVLIGTRKLSNKFSLIPLNIVYTTLASKKEGLFVSAEYNRRFTIKKVTDSEAKIKAILEKKFDFAMERCDYYQNKCEITESKKEEPSAAVQNRMQMLGTYPVQNNSQSNTKKGLTRTEADKRSQSYLRNFVDDSLNLFEGSLAGMPYPSAEEITYYMHLRLNKYLETSEYIPQPLNVGEFIEKYNLYTDKCEVIKAKKAIIIAELLEQIFIAQMRNRLLHWSAGHETSYKFIKANGPTKTGIRAIHRG